MPPQGLQDLTKGAKQLSPDEQPSVSIITALGFVILFTASSKPEEIQWQRLVYLEAPLVMHGKAETVLLAPERTPVKPSPALRCKNQCSQQGQEPREWQLQVPDCVAVPGAAKWKENHEKMFLLMASVAEPCTPSARQPFLRQDLPLSTFQCHRVNDFCLGKHLAEQKLTSLFTYKDFRKQFGE